MLPSSLYRPSLLLHCEDEGAGDFSRCLAMLGTGDGFLVSCGMLCHLLGLFSLLARWDKSPASKDPLRVGVGEALSMSNSSNSSAWEKTGLKITLAASSLFSRLKLLFLIGALFGCSLCWSTRIYFLGALGDYISNSYQKQTREGIKCQILRFCKAWVASLASPYHLPYC